MKKKLFRLIKKLFRGTVLLVTFPLRTGRPKRVLVKCPAEFHFLHLEPVVEALSSDPSIDVVVLEWAGSREDQRIPGVTYVSEADLKQFLFRPFDLLMTTEFNDHNLPSWLGLRKRAYFLHGMGPKVTYFASEKISHYDAVFVPGPFFEEKIRSHVRPGCIILVDGLPVLDRMVELQRNRPEAPSRRPVLLYAPSWSSDPDKISISVDMIEALAAQDICDCVIRPHPNLMLPDRTPIPDLVEALRTVEQKHSRIRLHSGPGTSVYDILPEADVLMSDISSVLFEFLVLDRPILLNLKDTVSDHYDADEIISDTRRASWDVPSADRLQEALAEALKDGCRHSGQRRLLLERMLSNRGQATGAVIKSIHELAG